MAEHTPPRPTPASQSHPPTPHAPPRAAAPTPVPALAPLPAGPMTAEEETELTAYHERFMQGGLTGADEKRAAKAGAPRMRQLLDKKLAWAKSLPSGETGGDYTATQRNLEWLDALKAY